MNCTENLYALFFIALSCLMISCSEKNTEQSLIIESEKLLDSIPSGSGIVVKNDSAYIVGDDATGIYHLNVSNFTQQKIPVSGFAYSEYREAKPVKHDLEAATLVNWKEKEYLLAIGSGSKYPFRDSMLMLNTSDFTDHTRISLRNFYKQLQHHTHTDSTQWNIEGVTAIQDDLILCNRGNNLLIRLKVDELLSYLFTDSAFPSIQYQRAQLPSIKNHEARLSGACTLDNARILFSASVEDTPDWTMDGPILGSFIGLYSWDDNNVVSSYLLQGDDGNPLIEKIESLDILRRASNGEIILLTVGDNDNGTSNLFLLRLAVPDHQ